MLGHLLRFHLFLLVAALRWNDEVIHTHQSDDSTGIIKLELKLHHQPCMMRELESGVAYA